LRFLCLGLFVGCFLLSTVGADKAAADHHEGGPKILQVLTLNLDAKDRAAVLTQVKALQGIAAGEGLPPLRVWLASYSGESVGRRFLTVEQANIVAFGSNSAKVQASAAIQK
jgi:hypothetical protein